MALESRLNQGDWIRAAAKNGSVIEGQAAHDMRTLGSAALEIIIAGDGGGQQRITINVNYWDVTAIRRNLEAIP